MSAASVLCHKIIAHPQHVVAAASYRGALLQVLAKASLHRWPPDSAVPDPGTAGDDLTTASHPSPTAHTPDLPASHLLQQQQQQQSGEAVRSPQTEAGGTQGGASTAAPAAGVAAGGMAAAAAASGATLHRKADTAQLPRHHPALTSRTASILTAGGVAPQLCFLYVHYPQPF